MKKVCVLLPWSFSLDSRAQRTARTMARHAEVHVYSAEGEDRGSPPVEGVRHFPVRLRPPRLDWLLRRTLFYRRSGGLFDAVAASGEVYDVVYAHDLPASPPALRLARRFGARLVYDVHDLHVETINQTYPESAAGLRRLRYSAEQWVMRKSASAWERRFIRSSDLVMTVSAGCLAYLEERYGVEGGIVVHNFPELREVPRTDALRRACGVPEGRPIVLYHGSFGRGRHLDVIVRSAGHLAGGAVLVLLGRGPLEGDLRALAARPGIAGRVVFHDAVPYEDLLPLVAGADLGLVLVEPINLSKRYALANKLTECMAAGVAVLASDGVEHRRVLEETGAGYLCEVTTPEALGARISALLADGEALGERGRLGRRAFREKYHWEADRAFERAFRGLVGEP